MSESADTAVATSAKEVLNFWFGQGSDDAVIAQEQSALWWDKQAATDQLIATRFGGLREAAAGGALQDWTHTPRGRLALIILIDQFSRNLFRKDPRAFTYDSLARRWCLEGLAQGNDIALRPIERVFFYLPLEHSESRPDQARSVELYSALAQTVPQAQRPLFDNYVDFARKHQEIVNRYGRFPHRNEVLGRKSTAEELAFLEQPGSSF